LWNKTYSALALLICTVSCLRLSTSQQSCQHWYNVFVGFCCRYFRVIII